MYKGSLFERLRGVFLDTSIDEERTLYQSIANNLSNIFLTYTGNAETVLDYGKVDLNNVDLTPLNSRRKIEKYLEESIYAYEKRLSSVSVSVMENQYDLSIIRIHIEGIMSISGEATKAVFKAKIYGDGYMKVQSNEY